MFKVIMSLILSVALIGGGAAVVADVNTDTAIANNNSEFMALNGATYEDFMAATPNEADGTATSVGNVFGWFGIDLNDLYAKGGVSESDMPFSNDDTILEAGQKSANYMVEQVEWSLNIFGDLGGFMDDLYDGNDTYEYPEAWLNSPYAIK